MNTHADKAPDNKSQSVSAADVQMQGGGEAAFQFVDNRPEAVAQRKLQEMANNSPQVKQLIAFQEMANNSPQTKQTAQLQAMADNYSPQQQLPIQKKENNTGVPDNLKTGIENLSEMSLDDLKVYRDSDKPTQLQAHAYAQGTDIHLGPGQEKHLPHEAWHVVQQKQGRVMPTMQRRGNVNVNDNSSLEKEADVMGAKALSTDSQAQVSQQKTSIQLHDRDFQHVAVQLSQDASIQRNEADASSAASGRASADSVFLNQDGQQAIPGQMDKNSFLNQLEAKTKAAADQILASIDQTSAGCPYIELWFAYYRTMDASQIERAIRIYAPATRNATDAGEVITHVVNRIKEGLQAQVSAGLDEVNAATPMELTTGGKEVTSLKPPEVAQLKSDVVQLGSKKKKDGYENLDAENQENVEEFKMLGRQAQDDAAKTAASRTDEVKSAAGSLVKSGTFIGLDVALPGLGTGLSAANAAKGTYDKSKIGKGGKELAKSAAGETAAAFFPYIAFARDLGKISKSIFQSDRGRTEGKLKRVEKQIAEINKAITGARALHQEMSVTSEDKESMERLQKAISRMEKALDVMENWKAGKSSSGKLPLLSGDSADDSLDLDTFEAVALEQLGDDDQADF